jgi:hypothetical protein
MYLKNKCHIQRKITHYMEVCFEYRLVFNIKRQFLIKNKIGEERNFDSCTYYTVML